MHDLKPIVEAVVQEGKTVITLIVDGGPDWSTGSLLNAMYFMRLWKLCNLDMLCVTSFAARYSAYNPIEHLWSVLSKKLASVRLSAVATGDNKAPYYLSGISEEQRKAKEAVVFDEAVVEITDVHWNRTVFDEFPVIPVPVKCSDQFPSDHEQVSKFLKAPLREIRDGSTYANLIQEFRFLLAHVNRHYNEIMFLKCQESGCTHCTQNPVRAKEVFSFLTGRKMKLFYPLPSSEHVGHFSTYLEMCSKKPEQLPEADSHLPSYKDNDGLGRCPHCPNFVFLSKTEKKRHFQVYHPKKRICIPKHSLSKKKFKCNHKLSANRVCGQMFNSIYKLRKHRKNSSHQAKRKRSTASSLYLSSHSQSPRQVDQNPVHSLDTVESEHHPLDTAIESDGEPDPLDVAVESDCEPDPLDVAVESDCEPDPLDVAVESDCEPDPAVGSDEEPANRTNVSDSASEDALCIICGLGEEEDEDEEVWIECTKCLNWVHESCLLPQHPYSSQDKDFLCPECYNSTKKRRTHAHRL